MPERLLQAARAELDVLVAIAGMADQRRVATFLRGLRIERMKTSRAGACERLNISTHQYHRALRVARLAQLPCDKPDASSQEMPVDLKSVSLGIGAGTPAPMSKYGSAKRPTAPADVTPRDNGGLSTGETGGNYKAYDRPNSGTGIAEAGAAAANTEMAGNSK